MASIALSKPYILLKDRQEIDDELLNSLLGLAVTDPSRPIQRNHHTRSPLKARDAFNFLYPPEYLACDSDALGEIMGKKASKKIQAFVNNTSLKPTQEPVMIRHFSMRDAGDKLGKLLEELSVPEGISTQNEGTVFDADEASRGEIQRVKRAQYRKEVFDLLLAQPDGKLAVITSFLTCFPLWENRERFYKDISTYTQYPVVPTHPILVGIDVGSQYSPTLDAGTLGAYKGECLIACSYQHVYLDPKAKKRRNPFFDMKLGSITTWASSRLSSKRPERGAPEDKTHERSEVSSLGLDDKSEIILSETDEDEEGEEYTFSLLYRDSLESDLYARSLRGR